MADFKYWTDIVLTDDDIEALEEYEELTEL